MSEPATKRLLVPALDVGQTWYRWSPARAESDPWLLDAVEAFNPVDTAKGAAAGKAAAQWLRERSLGDFRTTKTRLCVVDGVVEGFYSMAASQVELRTSDRTSDMGQHPIQPAALVTWTAKGRSNRISGWHLLSHAAATALKVQEEMMGCVALVVDPYDAAAADVWRRQPYHFRTSRTRGPNGVPRLWRALLTFFESDSQSRFRRSESSSSR